MSERRLAAEVKAAVHRYLDLMYDCDVTKIDQVFDSTAQLNGYRQGKLMVWQMPEYRKILAKRQSPKSQSLAREDEIVTVDVASNTLAFVKVKEKINADAFVDYLIYHRIDGEWLITAKAYHILNSET